ncbi:nuclear transport factor 2 family protein [Sediminicola arcticus]|jgi:ppGpp synthetase/RelA/SpoT-type nucleotidyltranferase|uniref:Nuclear transport factor 2 family protein n=1 Tax=Sediminicola arcticus TaxID=1574308 RepID=A0ABV2SV90_9FLAO
MRIVICFCFCLFVLSIKAQSLEEIAVKQTIETFFKGFHEQDSLVLKSVVSDQVIIQTIATKQDSTFVRSENYSDFLKHIVSIPATTMFNEKLLSFNIQIDGAMANAWTPYEFWLNDAFSHCGVNSFQLLKTSNTWKIIYLIDTRRKSDCK